MKFSYTKEQLEASKGPKKIMSCPPKNDKYFTISMKKIAGIAIPCLTIFSAKFEIICLSDWLIAALLSIMLKSFLNLHVV